MHVRVETKSIPIGEVLDHFESPIPTGWGSENVCLLIESVMVRIPIPGVYVDVSNDDAWEVLDGAERLEALRGFVFGCQRLLGLEFLTDHEGHSFSALPPYLQRRILETPIIVYAVQAGVPEEVKDSVKKRVRTS